MGDPWAFWSANKVASVTGCPVENVTASWPLIVDALDAQGIYDRDVAMGILGTVAIETASTFQPVKEAYWLPESWRQANLRYFPFYGRGFDQTTWEDGYREVGQFLGRDLLANPDLLLRADLSARVIAWRFAKKGVPSKDGARYWTFAQLCRDHDWEWLRKGIQGGTNGLDRLITITTALGEPPVTVKYNPQEPAHPQDKSFDCSQDSLEWAMWSLGRKPADGWMEATMIAEGVMSAADGLLDATGAGLAAFVGRQWGEFGFYANSEPSVTFDGLRLEGGHTYPLLIGGRKWGHWSGLAGYDKNTDMLLLANPADGWMGVHQTMNRDQFDALGPFSMVRVLHPDLLGEPSPVPEPAPLPFDRAAVAERLRGLLAMIDDHHAQEHDALTAILATVEA